jgi:uncharacterized membrane protein
MNSSNIRARARAALSGRWKNLAVITLVYSLVSSVAAYLYIGSILVSGPLAVAYAGIALRVIYGDRVTVDNVFDGFKNGFVNNFLLGLVNTLLIALWSLLLVVPGIVKSCAYSMSYFIAAENPGMSQSEARRRSEEMMMGHKMEYFILNLSFIGWIFLSIFTFGIGMFFVMPYMQTASAAFYDNLKLGQFVGGGSNGGSNGASNWNDDGSFSGPTGGSRFGRQSDSYDGGSSNNVFDNVFGSSKSNGNDDDDYTIG